MVTIWPAYDGSVITSRYPSRDVLKQISPKVSPAAPQLVPEKHVPSSSISSAGTGAGFVVPRRSLSEISLTP